MDVLHDRCAGLDIGKKDLKACVRTPSPTRRNSRRQEIRTFATTTNALLELRDWLIEQQVTLVVLEATGDYWRGAFYLLEDTLNVILVNAAHAKGLPGRKTDVSDSAWLAQLGECGLLKASFVPPEPIRHLRDLTRYRSTLTVERTREAQRLEKELEDAGIKISSVATDILGVSGRAMLAALIDGQDNAGVMAEMARGRLRTKIPALVEALTGSFGAHHAFLCRLHLTRIDELSATIEELSARIEQEMRPFARQIELLVTIPGVKATTAQVIIAETGGDMTRFRTPANLASWAGVCPGHHESAGIRRSGKRRHGNRWLGGALGTAAMAAGRTRERHLPGRPLRPSGAPPGQAEDDRRRRALHPDRRLAHAHRQRRLPGSRRGLLHQTRSRTCDATHHPPSQRPGPDRPLRPHPRRRVAGHRFIFGSVTDQR
jgi:transposase